MPRDSAATQVASAVHVGLLAAAERRLGDLGRVEALQRSMQVTRRDSRSCTLPVSAK